MGVLRSFSVPLIMSAPHPQDYNHLDKRPRGGGVSAENMYRPTLSKSEMFNSL